VNSSRMVGREVDLAIGGLKTSGLWQEEIQLGKFGEEGTG
jgi:hypothetical protein